MTAGLARRSIRSIAATRRFAPQHQLLHHCRAQHHIASSPSSTPSACSAQRRRSPLLSHSLTSHPLPRYPLSCPHRSFFFLSSTRSSILPRFSPVGMEAFLRSLSSILPAAAVPSNNASYYLKRAHGLAPASPTRSFSNMLMQTAVKSVTNGLMSHDDFYLHGLPAAKFSLDPSPYPSAALAATFAQHSHIDPFQCAEVDLQAVSTSLEAVIGSDHPILNKIAKYFFEVNGKRIRPAIVLLMARAMRRGLIGDEKDGGGEDVDGEGGSGGATVPTPIDLAEVNGKRKGSRYRDELDVLLPTQHRLAEIAEIMHTASLLHDDVIDEGETRRGVPTVNAMYGNKFAILGGDFLLARASVAMGRLRNHDVTELMSMIIEHLVKGEILQLKTPPAFTPSSASASSSASGVVAPSATSLDAHLSRYLTKTYYKTASLIANSCHSVSLLAAHPTPLQTIAYEYGRSLGLAFQVIDDILDVVGDSAVMGKAGGWDLTHGVVTAPVLYAMELDARVRERVLRGVREDEGEEVRRMVKESGGVERARRLAEELGENAVAAVLRLKPSVPRSALINLVQIVLNRQK